MVLHDLIERRSFFIRAAEKTFQAAIDQPGICGREHRVAKPKAVHRAVREIFDQRVGSGDHLMHDCLACIRLDVDGNAALVAIENRKQRRSKTDVGARAVALGGSTLITSAPRSASTRLHDGPITVWPNSSTRMPESGSASACFEALES